MKARILSLVAIVAALGALVPVLTACGDDASNRNRHEDILSYFLLKSNLPDESQAKWAAYFDFSDGMQHAYADQETKTVLRNIVQKLSGSSADFEMYSLADDSISPLPYKINDLYNRIIDAGSYAHQQAPIEKTLRKILDENVSAIMVTDFEEYTADGTGKKAVQHAPFATPYFKEWLQRDGDITFYITDYKEQGKDKHLYYIVFDKPGHELLSFFEDGLKGATPNYKRFQLSTHPFAVTADYGKETMGGTYHDANGEDNVSYSKEDGSDDAFKLFWGYNMEYYNFEAKWADIFKDAQDQSDKEIPAKERFKHLLSGATIDLSNEDCYRVTVLAARVLDATEDFANFEAFLDLYDKRPTPEEVADPNYEGDECYDAKGNLKPEYIYKPQPLAGVNDMLTFDLGEFMESYKANPAAATLAIDFDKNFDGKAPGLVRVDIVIAEAQPVTEHLNELFAWGVNENLSSAIRNVLQELRPVGTPVYTYFIQTLD